jgi:hypothetical protein
VRAENTIATAEEAIWENGLAIVDELRAADAVADAEFQARMRDDERVRMEWEGPDAPDDWAELAEDGEGYEEYMARIRRLLALRRENGENPIVDLMGLGRNNGENPHDAEPNPIANENIGPQDAEDDPVPVDPNEEMRGADLLALDRDNGENPHNAEPPRGAIEGDPMRDDEMADPLILGSKRVFSGTEAEGSASKRGRTGP